MLLSAQRCGLRQGGLLIAAGLLRCLRLAAFLRAAALCCHANPVPSLLLLLLLQEEWQALVARRMQYLGHVQSDYILSAAEAEAAHWAEVRGGWGLLWVVECGGVVGCGGASDLQAVASFRVVACA